jgi:hypothetical protein
VLPRHPARHAVRHAKGRIRAAGGTVNWGLKEAEMNAIRVVALGLIILGVLGLAYGGFSYTKETHEAKIGPIELNVKEKKDVNIPMWAGIGAIVIGGALLLGKR